MERDANPVLNVARWLPRSAANGPGERFVLWLQGCPLHCPGCWNPDTWSVLPRQLLTVDQVMQLIMETPEIEGVTLTGGEPFAQAARLVPLVRRIREAGLSLVVFTGYEIDELRSFAERQMLEVVDVLVTGRFVLAERDELLPLRGSRNQRIHFLTSRYTEADVRGETRVEFHVEPGGQVSITGFAPEELLADAVRSARRQCH